MDECKPLIGGKFIVGGAVHAQELVDMFRNIEKKGVGAPAGAYTRPFFSSTYAVLVTPPRIPLSNGLGGIHAPDVTHKVCSR